MEWIQIGFPQRSFAQTELDRHIIESPGSEAAIVPQSRNDHPGNGNLDVRPGLVENEEIQAKMFGKLYAGEDLPAPIKACEFLESRPPGGRFAVRQQVGIPAQGHRQPVAPA